MYLPISSEVILSSSPTTIKVKISGRGLYYGEPKQQYQPLKGPDDTKIDFAEAKFEGDAFKNGQGHISGPLVHFYYKSI
jgi:hypothetical protein